MTKELPMLNEQMNRYTTKHSVDLPNWSWGLGHSLVIGYCSLVILAASNSAAADTNIPPSTNLVALRALETNSPNVTTTDINLAPLARVDTNSPGFSNLEIDPGAIRNPAVTGRFDLQSFRIISERNIFNPSRRPFRGGNRRFEREGPPRARSESFALIGTMSYDKGDFAIFDGSSSEYRKVLSPADTIAGYKIAEIAPDHIKLEGTNGAAIELPVGKEMRKGEEEWRLADHPTSVESPVAAASDSSTNAPSASTPKTETSSSSAESDVLKRLLEKREQELNK